MEEETLPPKIGYLQSPNILLAEYEKADSPGFIPGIEYLNMQYKSMRRVRGDGNCFYRAFVFSYVESLLNDYNLEGERKASAEAEIVRITEVIARSKEELVDKHGYSEMAIESFHEVDPILSFVSGNFMTSRSCYLI